MYLLKEISGKSVIYTTVLILVMLFTAVSSTRNCVTMTSNHLPPPTRTNVRMVGHAFLRTEVAGLYWCARRCLLQRKCKSINYHQDLQNCQLNTVSDAEHQGDLVAAEGVLFYNQEVLPQVGNNNMYNTLEYSYRYTIWQKFHREFHQHYWHAFLSIFLELVKDTTAIPNQLANRGP